MMRETIAFSSLVGNGEAVFFPGLVEKREHAVMKEVEKIAERPVAGAQPSEDNSRIEMRQRPLRTGDAHEVDRERRRLSFRPIDRLNFAGGERERGISAKTRDFIGRIGEASERLAIGRHALEQANRLEEFEAIRLAAKQLFDFGKIYRRITSPARGGH